VIAIVLLAMTIRAQVPGEAFAEVVTVSLGTVVLGEVIVHDWDQDGVEDLVTVGSGIQVRPGRGDLGFSEPQQISATSTILRTRIADVDGDGIGDFLSHLSGLEDFVLLTLGADGSEYAFATPEPGVTLEVTDLNGDGRPDVLVLHQVASGPDLSILMGSQGSYFAPAAPASVGTMSSHLAVGLFGPDEWPDVFVSSNAGGGLSYATGLGDGTLVTHTGPYVFPDPAPSYAALISGDLAGSGHDDLVAIEKDSGRVTVWVVTNNGYYWMSSSTSPLLTSSTGAAWGLLTDLDLDGRLDVLATGGSQLESFLLPSDSGPYVKDETWGVSPSHVFLIEDLDDDGAPEFITSQGGAQPVIQIRRGLPSGGFALPRKTAAFVTAPSPVAVIDGMVVDLDGQAGLDLLHLERPPPASTYGEVIVAVSLSADSSEGDYLPAERFSLGATGGQGNLSVHDFTSDGIPDVLVRLQTNIRLLTGVGNGALLSPQTVGLPALLFGPSAFGDVTNDGTLDVVGVGYAHQLETRVIQAMPGDGVDALLPAIGTPISHTLDTPLSLTDLDGDGELDLLVASDDSYVSGVSTHYGIGDGTFLEGVVTSFPQSYSLGLVEDFNGDGLLDLLLGSFSNFQEAVVYTDSGDGAFSPHATMDLSGTSGPVRFAACDVDLNGTQDLVSSGSASTWIRPGIGDGTFGEPIHVDLPGYGTRPLIADQDGDGFPDIVGLDTVVGDAWILYHTGGPWVAAGDGVAGVSGVPALTLSGFPAVGTSIRLTLEAAAPAAPVAIIFGLDEVLMPFKGGVLVPAFTPPNGLATIVTSDTSGCLELATAWPAGIPQGQGIWIQCWVADAAGPAGASATGAAMTLAR
jgi:hypothetical protein